MQTRKRIVHELEFARPAFVFMNLINKKIFAAVFKKLLCQAIQRMVGKIHMFGRNIQCVGRRVMFLDML